MRTPSRDDQDLYDQCVALQATIKEQSTEIDHLHDEADEYRATIEELAAALLTVTLELESWNLTQGDPEALNAIAIGHVAIRRAALIKEPD